MRKTITALAATSFLYACASAPEDISPTYVSPALYQNYDCDELLMERERIVAKVNEVSAAQSKKATNDAVATGVGVILFFPALLFLASGSDRESELASYKGNYDALTQAAIQKKCLFPSQIQAEKDAEAEALRKLEEERAASRSPSGSNAIE